MGGVVSKADAYDAWYEAPLGHAMDVAECRALMALAALIALISTLTLNSSARAALRVGVPEPEKTEKQAASPRACAMLIPNQPGAFPPPGVGCKDIKAML